MPTNPLPGNILNDPNYWPLWRDTRYCDVEGSPEGSFFSDRGQIMRNLYVAHVALQQAQLDFYGNVEIVTNGDGSRALSRTLPHKYPKMPHMIVQGINSTKPMGMRPKNPTALVPVVQDFQARDTDDTPLYHVAEIVLQYIMPPFRLKEDIEITIVDELSTMNGLPDEGQAICNGLLNSRYISRHVKRMSKMLTIPRGLLKRPDGKIILEAIAVNEHVADYIYTWYQIPEEALPTDNWLRATNTVNDAVFDGHPAGTLLFAGDPEVKVSPNPILGKYMADVSYHFHSFRVYDPTAPLVVKGHNYIRQLDPGSGKMVPQLFSSDGTGAADGTRIFRDFDFRKFFRPDPS